MGNINVNWRGHEFKVRFMHGIKRGNRYFPKSHFSNEEKGRPSFIKRGRRTFCEIIIPNSIRKGVEDKVPNVVESSARYHRKDRMVKSNARKFALKKALRLLEVHLEDAFGTWNKMFNNSNYQMRAREIYKEMRTTFWLELFG